jgi:hypothetical protein
MNNLARRPSLRRDIEHEGDWGREGASNVCSRSACVRPVRRVDRGTRVVRVPFCGKCPARLVLRRLRLPIREHYSLVRTGTTSTIRGQPQRRLTIASVSRASLEYRFALGLIGRLPGRAVSEWLRSRRQIRDDHLSQGRSNELGTLTLAIVLRRAKEVTATVGNRFLLRASAAPRSGH